MNWEWILPVMIIGGLVLAIWAKVSGQTIPELIANLRDSLSGTKEDVQDGFENSYSLYK